MQRYWVTWFWACAISWIVVAAVFVGFLRLLGCEWPW